jgi:trk system potassium uptake protein TrkA
VKTKELTSWPLPFSKLQGQKIDKQGDKIHEKVLMAIGVDRIVHPEQESAERYKKLWFQSRCGRFLELSADY